MRRFKLFTLGTLAAISASVSTSIVYAADSGFTSHHSAEAQPYADYAKQLPAGRKLELREYLDYQQREPCQNYQAVPQGFVRDGCSLRREAPERLVQRQRVPQPDPLQVSNVLNDYEINFAFDSANIEPAATNTLDQVSREIKRYNPREVTIAGHADKAGPSSYNVGLSQRRAQAVSDALNDRGIANRILNTQAYGESRPAVDTRDGVALRENRRVVIEFRE